MCISQLLSWNIQHTLISNSTTTNTPGIDTKIYWIIVVCLFCDPAVEAVI